MTNRHADGKREEMGEITALFWDVGGVVLTNGWDADARRQAVEAFDLDWADLETRHELAVTDFETGRLTLDEYLERVVFWKPRRFRQETFKSFMFSRSEPHEDVLTLLAGVKHRNKYFMATLNNESLELNQHRIERFRLRNYFDLFCSSCFLGVTKPEAPIFRMALRLTQRHPDECVFTDDRVENVEAARHCGMHVIQYRNPAQLTEALERLGVQLGPSR